MDKNYIFGGHLLRFVISSKESLNNKKGCFIVEEVKKNSNKSYNKFTIAVNHDYTYKHNGNFQKIFNNIVRHELSHMAYFLTHLHYEYRLNANIGNLKDQGDITSEIVATTNEIYGEQIERLVDIIHDATEEYYSNNVIKKPENKLEVKNEYN